MVKQSKNSNLWRIWTVQRVRNRFRLLCIVPLLMGFFGCFILFTSISTITVFTENNLETNSNKESADADVFFLSSSQENMHIKFQENQQQSVTGGSHNSIKEDFVPEIEIDPDWQRVTDASDKFYVYSAYYDNRFKSIRIIAAAPTHGNGPVYCRLYDTSGVYYKTIDGNVQAIRENWGLKYSAAFILCAVSVEEKRPSYVSVATSASETNEASNMLRVLDTEQSFMPELERDGLMDFAVCVQPFHYNYNKALRFIEWMEFHKLMGVTHFTFYIDNIGENVDCLFRHIDPEQVSVLPWKLPKYFVSEKEIRIEGIFAALNDCLYRYRGRAKYLLMLDVDEMVVPSHAENYVQLLEQADKASNRQNNGVYLFRNGFFYLQWPEEQSELTTYDFNDYPLAQTISKQMLMLQKLRRKEEIHPHRERSKYICEAEKTVEVGNHFVYEMVSGYDTYNVGSDLAVLHHYRICEFGGVECLKHPSIIDTSISPFGKQLVTNVAQQVEKIGDACTIPLSAELNGNEF